MLFGISRMILLFEKYSQHMPPTLKDRARRVRRTSPGFHPGDRLRTSDRRAEAAPSCWLLLQSLLDASRAERGWPSRISSSTSARNAAIDVGSSRMAVENVARASSDGHQQTADAQAANTT
jgi:hypothetical protein